MLRFLWPVMEVLAYVILLIVTLVLGLAGTLLNWILWLPVLIAQWIGGANASSEAPHLEAPQVSITKLTGQSDASQACVDGVFEGGGAKAIAQIGAVAAARDIGLKWHLVGGTSGGAIVAAFLARGKEPREIWRLLTEDDLSRILNVWYLPRERALRRRKYFVLPLLLGLPFFKGLVSGDVFLRIMDENLRKDNGEALTFGDLRNDDSSRDSPGQDYRLKMVATDVTLGRPIVLPDDLPRYWEPWDRARRIRGNDNVTEHDVRDCFPVADAVRMSMSIPVVFAPYRLHLATPELTRGNVVEIVDGGVSSNFPIWIFDRDDGQQPTRPTFGFLLDESRTPGGERASAPPRIWTVAALMRHVVSSGIGAMDKHLTRRDEYRTARLGTCGVETTDFGLSIERQVQLYTQGYEDAKRFFTREFNWTEYQTKFRGSGKSVGAPS